MKVTVITPSYNQADFLERTLESVITQDHPDVEYLVYDGASTDGSPELIEKHDSDITFWESVKDRGQSHAINKGFERATGDVVTWLNSDDTLMEGALSKVVRFFKAHPDVDAVYGNFLYIDAQDRCLRKRRLMKRLRYVDLLFHDFLGQPAVFYRRSVLEQIGGLDESLHYSMDWDFFLRMHRASKMAHLNEYLATYRLHEEAKSSQEGDRDYAEHLQRIHQQNMIEFSSNRAVNSFLYTYYRIRSYFVRLYVVIRDNPLEFLRFYWIATGGRPIAGLLWRAKYH